MQKCDILERQDRGETSKCTTVSRTRNTIATFPTAYGCSAGNAPVLKRTQSYDSVLPRPHTFVLMDETKGGMQYLTIYYSFVTHNMFKEMQVTLIE